MNINNGREVTKTHGLQLNRFTNNMAKATSRNAPKAQKNWNGYSRLFIGVFEMYLK